MRLLIAETEKHGGTILNNPLTLETFAVADGVKQVPYSEVLQIRVEGQRVWVRFRVPGYSETEAANAEQVRLWGRKNEKLVE